MSSEPEIVTFGDLFDAGLGTEPCEGEPEPLEPGVMTSEAELREAAKPDGSLYVEYDVRGPRDVVLSGPVIGGWGPGRFHRNRRIAYFVLAEKYGPERVKSLPGVTRGRWAYLIKNLKGAT